MAYWMNEREVPSELLKLIDVPEVPNEFRAEVMGAKDEVENNGAVNYPTKARIEYYIHKYQELLEKLLQDEE